MDRRRAYRATRGAVVGEALCAQALGQVQSADLGDAVVDEPGRGEEGGHGGDGDDVAFSLGEHAGEEGAD